MGPGPSDHTVRHGRILLAGTDGYETHEVPGATRSKFRVRVFWPLTAESDKLGARFCRLLTNRMSQSYLPLQAWGNFFQFIPGRLGHNDSLDTAVFCLYMIFDHRLCGNPGAPATEIAQYVQSLQALQTCVGDPQLRRDPETLCASLIVQLCEVRLTPVAVRLPCPSHD